MFGWLKKRLVKREIAGKVDDMKTAKQGTLMYLWQFLSGFKGLILLLGATYALHLKAKGQLTAAEYLEFALKAMFPGGAGEQAIPVDPSALLFSLGALVSTIHAVKKALELRKAGVPAQFLNSIPPAAVDVKLLQAVDAAGVTVPPAAPVVTKLVSVPADSAAGAAVLGAAEAKEKS